MSCSQCEKARKAREAARQAKGKTTGAWSVTFPNGNRVFFDNRLAAMAYNAEFSSANGGHGMVRSVG